MNKPNVSKIFKDAKTLMSRRSPEILTGIGIAGMLTTTVLAVKATPKALKLIEEKKHEEHLDKLSTIETIKTTWKCYIPTAITCTASVACLIGASSVSLKRNAALATAYKLSETALAEYKEKVVETLGEKKEKTIREKIDKDHIDKQPVSNSEVIITSAGDTLCYDYASGRYFKSDIESLKKAINVLNRKLLVDMYVSLNEFYDEIGLENIRLGDELGWNIDKGLIDLDFSSQIADDGRPCIVISYTIMPQHGFDSFM